MPALMLASLLLAGGAFRLSAGLASFSAITRSTGFLVLWVGGVNATCLLSGIVLRSLEPSVLLAVAGALGVAMAFAGRGSSAVETTASTTASRGALALILAIVALIVTVLSYGWQIYQAWRFPVLDWDGLSYHLVTVDTWLERDAIVDVAKRSWSSGYPANGELMTLWLMAFTRSDDLADLTSVTYVPLLVAGTALLASSLGAGRYAAWIGGLLAALVPAVIVLGATTYVDVPTAGASLAGLGLLLSALDCKGPERSEPHGAYLLLWATAGISLGIAAGTKVTAAPMTALVLSIACVAVFRNPSRRSAHEGLVIALVAAAVFGGSWYLRNIAAHGNPVHPFAFGPFPGIAPTDLLAGVHVPDYFRALSLPRKIIDSWLADFQNQPMNYDVRPGGFGWIWPILLLPSLLFAIASRFAYGDLLRAGVLVVPLVVTALNPAPWWARLNLTIVAVGAATLSAITARRPRLGIGLLTVAVILASANAWEAQRYSNHIGRVGHDPNRVLTFAEVARLSRRSPAELRSLVSPWRSCAGFETIPAGGRVATDGSLTHPHLVVGPALDRVLLDPVEPTTSSAGELLEQLRADGAQYLVVTTDGPVDRLAMKSGTSLSLLADRVCAEKFPPLRVYAVDSAAARFAARPVRIQK